MGTSMAALRCESRSRIVRQADVDAVPEVADLDPVDVHDWALAEFRSTSPWAVAHAVAALGRHHSRPWLRQINVPTAIVVTLRDKVIPAERQLDLARRIPGATRSEEHTSELQSLMRISYAVFCLKKKKQQK